MNNTRTLAIAAILTAATLVVGTFATTTTLTQTALAYNNKKDNRKGNDNGNTITIQKSKQAATQSGFDNNQGQECENLICTHPGENAICVSEGAAVTTTATTIAPLTPECFRSLLTPTQLSLIFPGGDVDRLCLQLEEFPIPVGRLEAGLTLAGVSASVQAQVIQCLLNAGITFLE